MNFLVNFGSDCLKFHFGTISETTVRQCALCCLSDENKKGGGSIFLLSVALLRTDTPTEGCYTL